MFKRRDTDLYMDLKISLSESLTGFKKTITTLDDRQLVLNTLPGEVLKHGMTLLLLLLLLLSLSKVILKWY